MTVQPVSRGLMGEAESGQRRGITTSNESAASPPDATGSVSGPINFRNSTIEPGHPCVRIKGIALGIFGFDVDEVDVQPINLGQVLRVSIELRPPSAASRTRAPSS